jgi:glyoxylase-like metal-dependent hydrolase (beta-lactamase superfamily II)
MYLDSFSDNPFATNCWLVGREGGDEAIVVDPGFSPERVRKLLDMAGRVPVAVLATHGHHDHIGSAAGVCGDEVPMFIHSADRRALADPQGWGSGFPAPPVAVSDVRELADGDVLELAGLRIQVLHTPGHTPGSVCFRTSENVFSGDLVFAGSIGRYDFPNSSPEDMRASLERFLELPDELPVHPGHGPATTVGAERTANPFLAGVPWS